ncbi:MAG: hypothetical protein HQM03_01390 [Magnetococcales bacterium]|nr:hypothetical protein [Magnetococcales bacterium]
MPIDSSTLPVQLTCQSSFYTHIMEQCELSREMATQLERFMRTGEGDAVESLRQLEIMGVGLRERNMEALRQAPVSSADREENHRACLTMEAIQQQMRAISEEMEVLEMRADWHMLEMVVRMRHALDLLSNGFLKLLATPVDAIGEAEAIFAWRRAAEKSYRSAMVHLLQADAHAPSPDLQTSAGMRQVFHLFKRQEIYQLFRAVGLEIGKAGRFLHGIALQFT